MSKTNGKQTGNQRSNGQFAKGNKLGNRFKPGENANPNGRRGSLYDVFNELSSIKGTDSRTRKEKIIDKVLNMAERGSLKAAEMFFDRMEGKAVDRHKDINEEPIIIFQREE